ncbi:hypothetical protein A0H81_05450 [Grifola frondosa]|uniref:Uncharacterized protein n=1 Tax=Grifola frondosa TaxID=5627 RepID=A0A1C7MBV5_GRIFR|nr:hypothetical protein A0H81_05450 [Grifola frondosa]
MDWSCPGYTHTLVVVVDLNFGMVIAASTAHFVGDFAEVLRAPALMSSSSQRSAKTQKETWMAYLPKERADHREMSLQREQAEAQACSRELPHNQKTKTARSRKES